MPFPERAAAPLPLFYSYSSKDKGLRDKLETHLSLLQTQGVISGWHDRRIEAGIEWDRAINAHLEEAKIILLLVSADFLATPYCREVEIARAMERHERGEARVIPVILRPVEDWQSAPFGKLQALPEKGKAVTTWKNRDKAFANVARGIREAVMNLSAGTQHSSDPASTSTGVTTKARKRIRAGQATSGQDRTHQIKAYRGEASDLDLGALVAVLRRLAPPSWATYVASLPGAAISISHNLPIPEQVSQLIRWAESPEGPGLDLLWLTAKKLFPNFR